MPSDWWGQIKCGLFFGIGFACANAVIAFVVSVLSRAHT